MARRGTKRACGRWRWAASASSTAISAPARFMRFAWRWWRRPNPARSPATVVLGVLSLILWSLIVVVTLKYVVLLLRADNNGEGGTLSLTALATRALGRRTALVFLLGVVGASMFLGDAVITPAISVLSAVEGLKLVTPALRSLRRAAHHRHADRAVCRAEPRHGAGGELLRSGDGGLVRRDRGGRAVAHSRRPGRDGGDQSGLRRDISLLPRRYRAGDARRSSSSSSPAARRFMPISAISAASRFRPPGSAWCCRRC